MQMKNIYGIHALDFAYFLFCHFESERQLRFMKYHVLSAIHSFTNWTLTTDLQLCAGHYLLVITSLCSICHHSHFTYNSYSGILQGLNLC